MRPTYLPLLVFLYLALRGSAAVAQDASTDVTPPGESGVAAPVLALLKVAEPPRYWVVDYTAIASPVEGLMRADREREYPAMLQAMIDERNVRLGEVLVSALKSDLSDRHIELVYRPDQYPKLAADGKSDDFSDVHVDEKRLVLVWIDTAGFANEPTHNLPFVTHYEPWLVVHARLLDAETKRLLAQADLQVGCKRPFLRLKHVPLDPKYKFGSFNDVRKHADLAVQALVDAAGLAAQQVATMVKMN